MNKLPLPMNEFLFPNCKLVSMIQTIVISQWHAFFIIANDEGKITLTIGTDRVKISQMDILGKSDHTLAVVFYKKGQGVVRPTDPPVSLSALSYIRGAIDLYMSHIRNGEEIFAMLPVYTRFHPPSMHEISEAFCLLQEQPIHVQVAGSLDAL